MCRSATRKKTRKYILSQLALFSPEIIHLAIAEKLPPEGTVHSLKNRLPADWDEQKKFLNID